MGESDQGRPVELPGEEEGFPGVRLLETADTGSGVLPDYAVDGPDGESVGVEQVLGFRDGGKRTQVSKSTKANPRNAPDPMRNPAATAESRRRRR